MEIIKRFGCCICFQERNLSSDGNSRNHIGISKLIISSSLSSSKLWITSSSLKRLLRLLVQSVRMSFIWAERWRQLHCFKDIHPNLRLGIRKKAVRLLRRAFQRTSNGSFEDRRPSLQALESTNQMGLYGWSEQMILLLITSSALSAIQVS